MNENICVDFEKIISLTFDEYEGLRQIKDFRGLGKINNSIILINCCIISVLKGFFCNVILDLSFICLIGIVGEYIVKEGGRICNFFKKMMLVTQVLILGLFIY